MNEYVYIICVYIIYNVNKVICLLLTSWNQRILFFVLVHMDLVQGPSSFLIVTQLLNLNVSEGCPKKMDVLQEYDTATATERATCST